MDFVADQRPEAPVDQLMASEQPFAIKFLGDNESAKMGVVIAVYFDDRVVKTGFDQLANF